MNALDAVRRALEAYLDAVAAQREGRAADLAGAMMALEAHSRQPDPSLPAALVHYLESRSYRKAWDWLQGQTPQKGSCGR
jgi:hypothetical protein